LDEAFEIGDLVGKAEFVEAAGIKRVDVNAAGSGWEATVVIEVEDDEEVEEVDGVGAVIVVVEVDEVVDEVEV
jgi:hypothetical protein